jgi:hypothetical protein
MDNLTRELAEKGYQAKRRNRDSFDDQISLCNRYDSFSPMEFINEIAKTLIYKDPSI